MENLLSELKALGDSNRFRVCMMLLERPLCVCQLQSALGIAGGTLSRHLSILKNAGFVQGQKDGKWNEYYLVEEKIPFLKSLKERIEDDTSLQNDRKVIDESDRFQCSAALRS